MKFLFWVRQRRTQNSVRHLRWNVNYTRKTSHFRCWAEFWIQLCSMKLPEGIQLLLIVGDKAKGRISRQVFQENKARQIFRKTNISNVCVSGGKKCSFFGKFGVLCFLETPVLRFALLPYYRRNVFKRSISLKHWMTMLTQLTSSQAWQRGLICSDQCLAQ